MSKKHCYSDFRFLVVREVSDQNNQVSLSVCRSFGQNQLLEEKYKHAELRQVEETTSTGVAHLL